MEGGPVDELLDLTVECPVLDQLQVDAVADIQAVELAAPLVGDVLDGLPVNTPSVEQTFELVQG
jgi:hypothetical protein